MWKKNSSTNSLMIARSYHFAAVAVYNRFLMGNNCCEAGQNGLCNCCNNNNNNNLTQYVLVGSQSSMSWLFKSRLCVHLDLFNLLFESLHQFWTQSLLLNNSIIQNKSVLKVLHCLFWFDSFFFNHKVTTLEHVKCLKYKKLFNNNKTLLPWPSTTLLTQSINTHECHSNH